MSSGASDSLIGRPLRRTEDLRLITGKGRYGDDHNLPGQAYAIMVRSPHPHARIVSISKDAALAVPGVLAVFTGEDVRDAGLNPIPHDHLFFGKPEQMRKAPDVILENKDGSPFRIPAHHILPHDRVRFVGEAVAMVVAESVEIAKDAAEFVEAVYEELPFVIEAIDAIGPDSSNVWDDIPGNVCVDGEAGNAEATAAVFATAPKTVRLETHIQRVTGVTMEPRTATGSYDIKADRYTLYAGSSGVVRHKVELAAILGIPEEQVRVLAEDVGGNFGTKNNFYPEYALVAWASRLVGKPIKWVCERQEAFLSDYQGRDLTVRAELALDDDGRFLAVRSDNISNVGAYFATFVPLRKGMGLMTNIYDVGVAHVRARAVVTNTVCTTPFRSAGRPEAIYVAERLIDIAAQRYGFNPIELRRMNMVRKDMFPYRNALSLVYDNGDFSVPMDAALRLIDWDGFPERRRKAAEHTSRRRGIALANYIEITTGFPREKAEVRIDPEKGVEIVIGTMSSGQGHETSFAQVAAEWLGVPLEAVHLVTGDTDRVSVGGGSVSGRSMRFAGVVIRKAIEQIVEQAKQVVAFLHDVNPGDVTFEDGIFHAVDTSYTVFDIARIIAGGKSLPQGLDRPLHGECDHFFKEAGFPFGAQACEVEVDLLTGVVEVLNMAAVDDVGRAINPLILHGQTVGGAVQGLGQALMEHVQYDSLTGQLMSGSLMDYALPRAEGTPNYHVELSEMPSPTNPLGIRAGGEGGTTPALAVVVGAVVNALSEFGVEHIEMPVTSERIWRALEPAYRDGRISIDAARQSAQVQNFS